MTERECGGPETCEVCGELAVGFAGGPSALLERAERAERQAAAMREALEKIEEWASGEDVMRCDIRAKALEGLVSDAGREFVPRAEFEEVVGGECLRAVERNEARAALEQCREALELVLLYHSSGTPWDEQKAKKWQRATGQDDASTRVLCDHVRCVLAAGGGK